MAEHCRDFPSFLPTFGLETYYLALLHLENPEALEVAAECLKASPDPESEIKAMLDQHGWREDLVAGAAMLSGGVSEVTPGIHPSWLLEGIAQNSIEFARLRSTGEFVFPPAVVESFDGVLGRTDWQSIVGGVTPRPGRLSRADDCERNQRKGYRPEDRWVH
jgi:hypothetical protein